MFSHSNLQVKKDIMATKDLKLEKLGTFRGGFSNTKLKSTETHYKRHNTQTS